MGLPMTADAKVGARIVRVIASVISVPSLAILAVAPFGPRLPMETWISIVFSLAMVWALLRGSHWARGWIIVSFVLSGVLTSARIVMNLDHLGIINAVFPGLMAVSYFLGAGLLGWSSAVNAYFARENEGAALNLSSPNGV